VQVSRVSFSLCAVVTLCSTICSADLGHDSLIEAAKRAIVRNICYEIRWSGPQASYKRGTGVPIEIIISGERFYGRTNALERLGGAEESHTFYFVGRFVDGEALVIAPYEMGIISYFNQASLARETILIPEKCEIEYEAAIGTKAMMIEGILDAVGEESKRQGHHEECGESIGIEIGEFNSDSPRTFVRILSSRIIYEVELQEPDTFPARSYTYVLGPVENQMYAESLREIVAKNAIRRAISIDGSR